MLRTNTNLRPLQVVLRYRNLSAVEDAEPRRVCRRQIFLSHAAMPVASRVALYRASASAGGIFPMASSRRRWLNQSTHSRVANSTASRLRQGPRLWITSVL